MSVQAKYDPQSDRLRLTLWPGAGSVMAFWVTRRQLLGWLHAMTEISLESDEGMEVAQANAEPPSRRRRLQTDIPTPLVVQAIRLRRLASSLKVVFVAGEGTIGVDFPISGLRQLEAMLRNQAERAGWDVAAALDRLDAAKLAAAAMKKARNFH